ncbi:MAG: glycosyltransferase [Candidatus Melainabacteria bacterium]|nr:glycosyltransferase [Candidatus Melainabacteria bacterium]
MAIASNLLIDKGFTELNKGLVLNPTSEISIVIPSFNSLKTITKLIKSIEESIKKPYEVIIVDDCSVDGSINIVLNNYPWIKTIKLNKNSGPSKARNIGVEVANKEIILFLDSDVILTPVAIEAVEKRHKNYPDIAGLQGHYHWEAANPGSFPSYKALINHFWYRGSNESTEVNFLVTYACTIKKQILLEAGGFSELYKGADVEDYELGYRIAKKYKLLHEPMLEVYHHFPGFIKNTRNYIDRGMKWFPLFVKNKKFDTSGATSSNEAISRLLGILSFASLIPALINKNLLSIFLITTILYLLVNLKFFIFCFQKKGIKYFLLGIFFHYVSSIVICLTMFFSVIKYILKR